MRFVMEFSLDATDTMLEGADPVAGTQHKNEASFQNRTEGALSRRRIALDDQ